jgi:hypothetical protein
MARVDDYKRAAELAKQELGNRNADLLADFSGAVVSRREDRARLDFHFLGRPVRVLWPEVEVSRTDSSEEIPIQQQVLILHYLQGAWQSKGPSLTGEWMAFQDVPDGRFYHDAFQRRAKLPLLQGFGRDPEQLEELARTVYSAERIELGDVSMSVPALPLIRAALVLWAGDEEFPPEGNILFDRNTASFFSAEDIAWLAGMIVYPLVGMAAAAPKKA